MKIAMGNDHTAIELKQLLPVKLIWVLLSAVPA